MSLQRQSRIACDINPCPQTGPWVDVDGMTPGAGRWTAWRAARDLGWERDDYGDHRCPAHSRRTQRAARITALVAEGLRDQAIGQRLGLTRGAVQHIRATLGIAGQRPGRPSGGREHGSPPGPRPGGSYAPVFTSP